MRGFAVSAAPRPTSSVPAKAKAAVTKTEQSPLKPFSNAPGFCQYLPYEIRHIRSKRREKGRRCWFYPDISFIRTTSDVNNDGKDNEADDSDDLYDGEDEFCLAISSGAKEVDYNDRYEKDGDLAADEYTLDSACRFLTLTQAAALMCFAPSQKDRVREAAIISNGIVTSQPSA